MKKHLFFVLIFALCAVFVSNAQTERSSLVFKYHNTENTQAVASNSTFHPNIVQIGTYESLTMRGGRSESRRYEDAVHKRNAGIGLTAAGATCLTGGAALLAFGVIGIQNDNNGFGTDTSPLAHIGMVAGGVILAIAGTGMTIPGAILLAKGTHDMKKFKASQSVN